MTAIPERKIVIKEKEEPSQKIEKESINKKLKWKDRFLLKMAKKRSAKIAKKQLSNQKEKNPFNILSFIFSLTGIIAAYSLQIILLLSTGSILAIVLGIIGLRRNRKHRGFGILGLGIGTFALLILLGLLFGGLNIGTVL